MRLELLIEGHLLRYPVLDIADGLVGAKIDLFIFEVPLQSFHKYIVSPPPSVIHADLNPPVFENLSEF